MRTSPSAGNSRVTQAHQTSRSLSQILAENHIREDNLQYQQLLIRSKELEIEMEDTRNRYEGMVRERRKGEKKIEDARVRRDRAKNECSQKRHYLNKYHQELDKKFRGNREDLFSGLAKLQRNLLEIYSRDEERLQDSLKAQQQEQARLVKVVEQLQEKRDSLGQQIEKLRVYNEEGSGSDGVRRKDNEQEELKSENKYLSQEIEKLHVQRKHLEDEQRVLKRILNVEELHRKHGGVILGGIKKLFLIRLKEQRYKQAVSKDYAKNLVGLRDIITKRKKDRQTLSGEVMIKQRTLDQIMDEVNAKNHEYSQLQDQYMRR